MDVMRNKIPEDGQQQCGSNSLALCIAWSGPAAPAELRYGTCWDEAFSLLIEALSDHLGS